MTNIKLGERKRVRDRGYIWREREREKERERKREREMLRFMI